MEDSRFTVTVESENKKNGIHTGASIITRPLRSSAETAERGDAVVGSQPDTWLHDAGWRRKRSLAQLTREALPRMENYRNSKRALKRPSLGELHGDNLITEEDEQRQNQRDTKSPTPVVGIKLGWIQGVLIPCLLNIWGVMLFRGIYYIISRSLGPEFGASVGIIFAFANAVAASMNTIGFCDSMNDLLSTQGLKIIDNGPNDVRIVGTIALILMCIICAVGMDWESKAQNFLIAIIIVAMVDFMVGTFMGPKDVEEISKGFVGLSATVFDSNLGADFRYSENLEQNFFTVFAIFFPSVTGIQAGANISGDLKDPASAIPKGTLLALLISMVSYALMVLISGGGALRDASGNLTDVLSLNGTVIDFSAVSDCVNTTLGCKYGLHNSYSVMQLMSAWGPLIYGGCWAATLSTALTNLLSVPRLIQALGVDRIYPGLIFFAKPYGKHGEPYRGYVLTFFVSLIFLLIADLNTIAPLISNFYLASYALINFCTFHAALVRPLGWRPTFRYYNVWVSLLGFLMCVAIMLLISWVMSLVTFAIFFTLYLIVHYRKPDVNWGSSTQAQMYKTALASAHSLARTGEHVKNYWPQLLVLAGRPQHRPALVDLAHLLTKAGSLMIVGDISPTKMSYKERARAAHLLTLTTSRSFTISEKSDKEKEKEKEKKKDKKPVDFHKQIIYKSSSGLEVSNDQLTQMSIFQRKQEAGTVDVWWLYDDGGLTMLLPYILSQRSSWASCKLRVFALANRHHELELEERNMANLLAKFRIDYSSLTMVQDITEAPQPETKQLFDDIIKSFVSDNGREECRISESELSTLAEKTSRQLRLRELLLANSQEARLVVMSLPMPRKGSISAPLYMAWLEVMSRGLPPMMFVRGNHTSVLTFYS
ncbi:PREDICTED: bumetanide-sensitive sodium-(potassium)-chloride cotransporter-like [Papilio polytes]|uniref:bumetanide-sensitive sodium-(potassium)-chloride cotransporter-like n=1 Tax=Papilio polytes TaxID=76194 RepID=UPI000676736A|nr:PREDICTED: bumetanide-sensitive sodium-(potassium)-chloride cotransporter-like [Papilio polytes]